MCIYICGWALWLNWIKAAYYYYYYSRSYHHRNSWGVVRYFLTSKNITGDSRLWAAEWISSDFFTCQNVSDKSSAIAEIVSQCRVYKTQGFLSKPEFRVLKMRKLGFGSSGSVFIVWPYSECECSQIYEIWWNNAKRRPLGYGIQGHWFHYQSKAHMGWAFLLVNLHMTSTNFLWRLLSASSVISENVAISNILLKTRFFGVHFCRDVIGPQMYRIQWNNGLRRSRSFKITNFGSSGKPVCSYLCVNNSNLSFPLSGIVSKIWQIFAVDRRYLSLTQSLLVNL